MVKNASILPVLLLSLFLPALSSCRTVPFPDDTREYREALQEELGHLEWQGWPEPLPPESLGPREREFHTAFRVTRSLRGDPGQFPDEPFAHRMGMVPWRNGMLGVQIFAPADPSRGTVFFTHGYLAHMGVFVELARFLTEEGFTVLAFDLPGHGFSDGPRADIGSFSEYGEAIEDLLLWAQEAPQRGAHPLPQPWYGLGHSTGATALVIHGEQLRRRDEPPAFRHRVLIAPLIRPVHWRIGITWARLTGRIRRHYRPLIGPGRLLGSYDFPVNWALELSRWNRELRSYPPQPGTITILQGDADDVVAVRYNLRVLGGLFPESTVCRYPDLEHVIHRQSESTLVMWRDVVAALDDEVPLVCD